MKSLRFAAVLALQAALVAAAARPGVPDVKVPDDVDPRVLRANYEAWQALPETRRDVLRERWGRFAALPASDQETLLQRHDALQRLEAGFQQRQGREPSADERASELQRIVEAARRQLLQPGETTIDDAEVHRRMEARTRRHVTAFLDHAEKRGDVSATQVARLRSRPLAEQLREALLQLKSEQLSLLNSEGVRPEEADELLLLSPMDVAARAESRRQQVGFLGSLGTLVPLADADRKALEGAATDQEMRERLRDLKAPQIRELLATRGVSAEHVEELLSGPVNELEREAHALFKQQP